MRIKCGRKLERETSGSEAADVDDFGASSGPGVVAFGDSSLSESTSVI